MPKMAEEIEGQTVLHCNYVSKRKYVNGGWVNIYPTTFLVEETTGDSLQMIAAINVPVAPEKYFFSNPGELKSFALIFPLIPKSWKSFHLQECAGVYDGFNANHIQRNDSGIYQLEIK